MIQQIAQISIILIGIVCLIFALAYFFKKLNLNRNFSDNPIRVLNAQSIGGKDKLFLIEVDNCRLLLSAGSNGLQKIHVFSEQAIKPGHFLKNDLYREKATQ